MEPRPAKNRRAFLVAVCLPSQQAWVVEEHLDELADLSASTGVKVVGRALQMRKAIHPKTFIGTGKAEEIKTAAEHLKSDLIIFDDDLSASQVKNLEKILEVQVIDRSGLILELFDLRARTKESRTQVELARLNYLLPRLTRLWTHLSRQAGGIGVRGGEGETQLEADRRMLRVRIKQLKRELKKIEKTRGVQRSGRKQNRLVALAGYTNAGKSTLFNVLTQSDAYAKNKLFATLDSKKRRGAIGPQQVVVFADTVGFIRKLPHHLVASFRSTLEEIAEAELVLHVIDRSNPRWEDQKLVAEEVLKDLEIPEDRVLTVFNKVDQLQRPDGDPVPSGLKDGDVWLSSVTGDGIDILKEQLRAHLYPEDALPPVDGGDYRLPPSATEPEGSDDAPEAITESPTPTTESVDDPATNR